MATIKLENRNQLCMGALEDLKVGKALRVNDVNQGLEEKEYDPKVLSEFIQRCEDYSGHKYKVLIPFDRKGRRYVWVTRVA